MSMNRIQKLLFSEYCDFEDVVLLESPFAETTREGKGIRQIQLGLTPTKLILAEDFLSWNVQVGISQERKRICLDNFAVSPELDPDIETLELVSVIPIECVNLSIFHRRKKRTLKARLCNGRVLYFELGGSRNRKMLWNLWRERVKFLSPEEDGSSVSEASAASSSSCSTLYLVRRRTGVTRSGKNQIWNLYGKQSEDAAIQKSLQGAGNFHDSPPIRRRWTDRNLFPTDLSDVYDEPEPEKLSFTEYDSIMGERYPKNLVVMDEVKENYSVDSDDDGTRLKWSLSKEVEINPINDRHEDSFEIMIPIDDSQGRRESSTSHLVHRFGSGVQENCGIGLYLFPLKSSTWDLRDSKLDKDQSFHLSPRDFIDLMDAGVNIWENGICSGRKSKPRHLRRYGLSPCPQFFHGLGPFWEFLTKGDKYSVQLRRTASAIELHKAPSSEFALPLSKHQLSATISCEFLTLPIEMSNERQKCELVMSKYLYTPLPSTPIFFWTTDLSYWPRSSRVIYHKQRKIFKRFSDCMNDNIEEIKYKMYRKNLEIDDAYEKSYSLNIHSNLKDGMINEAEMERKNSRGRKKRRLKYSEVGLMDYGSNSSSAQFKRMLRLHIKLTAWDFDSTTIAYQITMIDRDLFLQIPVSELGILVNWKSYVIEKCFLYPLTSWHKGTPCMAAFITFSHRISCLISSEILKGESVKVRARLIARFINAANKCYQLRNFQSCHSIICGLQSPAIYRLQQTWHHLRHRHANKYEVFEHLCKFYKKTRLQEHDDFSKYSKRMPFIPCINFLIAYLLDRIPNERLDATSINTKKLVNKYCQDIRMRKHNLNHRKEMEDLTEPFALANKLREGSVSSNCHSKLIRFLSAFRIWPSISHQRHKFTDKEYERKSPAAPQVIKNDRSSWIEKAAPELKTYFTAVSEEDCRIKDSSKRLSLKKEECHSNNEVFHDYRMELYEKAAEMLLSSQFLASSYALVQSDLAREYLLKARYKEHNENYELSFLVENT